MSWQGAYVGACPGGACGIDRPYAGYPGAYGPGPMAYVGQARGNPGGTLPAQDDPNKIWYEAAIGGGVGAGLGYIVGKSAMIALLGGAVGMAIPLVLFSMAKTA